MWRMGKDPVHTGRTLNAAVSSPSQDVKTPSKLLIHQGKQFVHWAFFFFWATVTPTFVLCHCHCVFGFLALLPSLIPGVCHVEMMRTYPVLQTMSPSQHPWRRAAPGLCNTNYWLIILNT